MTSFEASLKSSLATSLILAAIIGLTPTQAGTEFPIPTKCPVGGEKFTHRTRVAWTEYGKRPDGKVYSNWISPAPLAECPGNRLLIVGDYSKDDVEKLKTVVEGDEYRTLRKSESPYYGAAWLMRRLEREPKVIMAMLQRAGWESDSAPDRKKRYMREMIGEARKAAALEAPDSMNWWQINWMIGNALRELSAWDEANAALNALPFAKLDVPIPENRLGNPPEIEEEVSPLPGFPKVKRKRPNILNTAAISEAKTRRFLFRGFRSQLALIGERNAGAEPVSLVPEREQLRRCKWFAKELSSSEAAVCNDPAIADKVKTYAGSKESNYD